MQEKRYGLPGKFGCALFLEVSFRRRVHLRRS
jgi:hypothetical protein